MEKKWWALVVVSAATFMLLLDVTIVVVALPTIQHGLNASFTDVQWVIDAYTLTLAALLLVSGSLADRFGRRRIFLVGLTIFTLGSLLCGLAQSPLMLTISRSAQGVGGAMLFATSLALIAQNFEGKERGIAFGVWGSVTGVATSLGPIFGGLLTTGINWRAIFIVNIPIGIGALVITLMKVDGADSTQASRPDWPGFATLTSGLLGLVYGLLRAGEIGWSDSGARISLVLGAAFILAFLAIETKVSHPMLSLSLFKTPTFVGGSIATFAMNGSLYAVILYMVIYLQDDKGFSPLGTGLRVLIISLGALSTSFIAGRASNRVPVRWLIGPGLIVTGIGLLLMANITGTSPWTHLIPGFLIAGLGSGFVNPPLASTAVGVVEPQRSGMASGVNITFRQVGIATSVAALGSIFASTIHSNLTRNLASIPALANRSGEIATALGRGAAGSMIKSTPPAQRQQLVAALHASFASTMNELLVVVALIAIVGGTCALLLIRTKDFVASRG